MLKYTVKRLLQSLVTIFLIATAVFLMMRCLPTDYYFTEEQLMKFTEEQKKAYTEVGGTPFLDNQYTVFGEVEEGLDVVEKIQNCETLRGDRPKEDVSMQISVIEE